MRRVSMRGVRAVGFWLTMVIGGMPSVYAANWLMLQGTEPKASKNKMRVWGFIETTYQHTGGTVVQAGKAGKGAPAAFNMVGPDLKSRSSFNIQRARLGARGNGFRLDPNANFFLLAEFGNNGITEYGKKSPRISDASITLNYFPGARVRLGQFKTPGAEEGLQAIHTFRFINFSNATNYLLLERFIDKNNASPEANGALGAFRDIGVQVFDSYRWQGKFDLSYALMIGNGNGIGRSDNNGAKDYYAYGSLEYIYHGQGLSRQGSKVFVWHHEGNRDLERVRYERNRSGFGVTFHRDKLTAAFEYILAEGMMFNGRQGACSSCNLSLLPRDKGNGWYIQVGRKLIPKLAVDFRYDTVARGTEDGNPLNSNSNRKFTTWTFGVQWIFNQRTRATLNYEKRSAEAPDASAGSPIHKVLEGIDDRVSMRLLHIF